MSVMDFNFGRNENNVEFVGGEGGRLKHVASLLAKPQSFMHKMFARCPVALFKEILAHFPLISENGRLLSVIQRKLQWGR